ncbi:hypothetical protein B0H15DRAFT_248601 [Mycena belliarum]|uniref:Uncharacterized protein n=1 Tax=Mycena belliarum TaxID=1033014 RepID=A0AAD6UAN4_9AGAR|nr:hypothetical protein B0H15DRAFT_248601 [Mycena belliae]
MPLITGNTARAPIVSVSIQGILYGFSVCMFGMSVWVLVFQRRDRRLNLPMLVVACTLWILSTIRMFIDISLTTEAFTFHTSSPTGPEKFLSDFSGPVSLLDNTIYGVQTLIGDAVVIYRCYIVWDRVDVIMLPSMAWAASLGILIYILNSFAHGTISGNKILIFYATTLSANLSATCLLAFRIWKADRDAQKHNSPHSSLRPLLIVIMESGALYSMTLIMALITIIHFLPMEYVVNSIIPAVISITFNMIFIRVGLARNHEDIQAGNDGKSFPLSAIEFHHTALSRSGLNQDASTATMEDSSVHTKAAHRFGSDLTSPKNHPDTSSI